METDALKDEIQRLRDTLKQQNAAKPTWSSVAKSHVRRRGRSSACHTRVHTQLLVLSTTSFLLNSACLVSTSRLLEPPCISSTKQQPPDRPAPNTAYPAQLTGHASHSPRCEYRLFYDTIPTSRSQRDPSDQAEGCGCPASTREHKEHPLCRNSKKSWRTQEI
jgi:hypothetical protein